jgi:hypothetical protein
VNRYWETASFRRLQREWTRRLAESGFRDIETADGNGYHRDTEASILPVDIKMSNGDGHAPISAASRRRRQEGTRDMLEFHRATRERARRALDDEMLWRGLPPRARKFWALVATLGFDVKPAGRIVGVSRRKAEGWRDEILRRIECSTG